MCSIIPDAIIDIVGNKSDREEDFAVDCGEAEEFAKKYSAPFFETSAKNGSNVDFMFQKVADVAHTANSAQVKGRTMEMSETVKGGCC